MNAIFTFLLTLYLFPLLKKKVPATMAERTMVRVGIFIPLLDIPVRLFVDQQDFILFGQYFHSILLNTVFWGALAALFWVYTRNLRFSALFLMPVAGLFLYAMISLGGTGYEFFWYPLYFKNCHLNIVKEGYFLFSLVLILGLLLVYFFPSRAFRLRIGFVSLIGVLFIVIIGIKAFSVNSVLKQPDVPEAVSAYPLSHFGTEWQLSYENKGYYRIFTWNLFGGKLSPAEPVKKVQDKEVLHVLLLEPEIDRLYRDVFQNPVSEIEVGKEGLELKIKEATLLNEFWWLSGVQLKKNRSGKTLSINTTSGFLGTSEPENKDQKPKTD